MFQFGKPIYADYFIEALHGLSQGLQTFLSESHYTTVRGQDILRVRIVLSCQAGFCPRAVVWIPWSRLKIRFIIRVLTVAIVRSCCETN